MFFTQEDYRKIEKWLLANSRKDTDFAGAATPLKGNETVVLVQNGKNVKASVKDVVEQLFLLGVSDFVNITDKYGESYISLSQAIELIPYRSRKIGQVVTFLDDTGKWAMFQFQGTRKNQWGTLSLWVDLIDLMTGLTITDSEDIVTETNSANQVALKFADKTYNEADYSGLGRVYLRKNIVNVEDPVTGNVVKMNYLTQSMISKENTIYIVQYSYNLNGQTITIPSGCVLLFEGGSISDGSINFTNSILAGKPKMNNIISSGTLNMPEIDVTWLGASTDNGVDSSIAIQCAINIAGDSTICKKVFIPAGTYAIANPIKLIRNKNIELYGAGKFTTLKASSSMDYMIGAQNMEVNNYISPIIHDISLDGNRTGEYYINGNFNEASVALAKSGIYLPCGFIYSKLYNINIYNINGWAIDILEIYQTNISGCTIRNCDKGIYLANNVNGVGITNNEFGILKNFAICLNSGHNTFIRNNVIEVIGNTAIVIGNGGGVLSISDNYFEDCTINGLILNNYSGVILDIVHSDIFVNGVNIGNFHDTKDNYPVRSAYPSVVNIENNDFQHAISTNDSVVLASAMINSIVSNNKINSDIPTILTALDNNSFSIKNVEVSRNSSTIKVKSLYAVAGQTYSNINNVYSVDGNTVVDNMNSKVFLSTYGGVALEEQDALYKGKSTYKASANLTIFIRTGYNFGDGRIDLIDTTILENVIFNINYNLYREGVWSKRVQTVSDINTGINLQIGDIITLPSISVVGGLPVDAIQDYEPKVYGYSLNPSPGIIYSDSHIIKIMGNEYVNAGKYNKVTNFISPLFQTVSGDLANIEAKIYSYRAKYNGLIVTNEGNWYIYIEGVWKNYDGTLLDKVIIV